MQTLAVTAKHKLILIGISTLVLQSRTPALLSTPTQSSSFCESRKVLLNTCQKVKTVNLVTISNLSDWYKNETMGGVNNHWNILKIFQNISEEKELFMAFFET